MHIRPTTLDLEAFWQSHQRFLHCTLTTETPHPDTHDLSHLACTDLAQALDILQTIDLAVLQRLKLHLHTVHALKAAFNQTWQQQGRVFILGCGASGRMAVCLENAWRAAHQTEQVVGVIAGGDFALVRSIEQFEDQPELGIRQLQQQGFGPQDLLIATSASGESPFVLAAVEYAQQLCQAKPWLLYCNPNTQLHTRNPEHLSTSTGIAPWCLDVGPMALTGSTRMQATTAMQMALGLALLADDPALCLTQCEQALHAVNFTQLIPFIEMESRQPLPAWRYAAEAKLALTVLTDLTERTPTFNIAPLYNDVLDANNTAPYAFEVLDTHNRQHAWQCLRQTKPCQLDWPAFQQTTPETLLGFDFHATQQPAQVNMTTQNWQLNIANKANITWSFDWPEPPEFSQQILHKILLNTLSTLVMGRLGYYSGNLMTHVQPANHKLFDRTIRYVQYRYQQRHHTALDYATAADRILHAWPQLQPGESLVEQCSF